MEYNQLGIERSNREYGYLKRNAVAVATKRKLTRPSFAPLQIQL